MKIDIKKLPQSRVLLTIELVTEEFEKYLNKAASELGESVQIKGFRKGNAPRSIIEERLGKDRILNRASELAIRQSYVKAVVGNELETIEEPAFSVVSSIPSDKFIFRAEVTVLPEVKLGDYTSLPVRQETVSVTETELASALKTLQKSRANYTTVSRPARTGDRVEINFETTVEGKAIEDGKSSQHPLIIGEGHFMKGFEEELVGMKEGENKNFSLVAPKDYGRRELAGQKVDFAVKMNLVQAVQMPEMNDEFAGSLGRFSSLDELKKGISDGLQEEKRNREREKTRLKIMEVLIERSAIELPAAMLEAELAKMEGEFTASLERLGIDKESYLAHLKKTPAELKSGWSPQAEKRARSALILREIAKREGIKVGEEEVAGRINEILKTLPSPDEAQKIDLTALQNYVRGIIRNEKVFELLESRITN